MKKLSRKVLSVFVALMLVLGIFSVVLPTAKLTTNVKAETAQQTFDYSVLLGDKSRGFYVPDTRIVHNSDGIDHLGIFNSQGLAVRYDGALGVADAFFSGTPVGADADEIHPYIVYNVVPGTTFKLSSAGYNEKSHKDTGCNDDERFLNFYISNDGINWIPVDAKKEFMGVWSASASYDAYDYSIDNVGLKTNFVKVEYPMTMASRRTDTTEMKWAPNESLMVTSVTFAKPETYNANGETLFQAKLYSTQKELYDSYFTVFPKIMCGDSVSDPENLANHYKAATVTYMNNVAWGTYEKEKERSYVAMVEPGSRFYLETANQTYMRTLGQFMVGSGEISSIDQARIRVYTSATLSDNASDWTEWQPMEYTMYASGATTPIFNFYLPEDHVYVKIVFPHKGDFRQVMLNGAAVSTEAGNTGCFFNDMVFTPYKKGEAEETYDYTVSGTTGYLSQSNTVEHTNGLRAKNDGGSKNLPNGHPDNINVNSPFKKGHFSATYAVEGGKMFSLEYAVRLNTNIYGYGDAAYKANTGNEMGFELSVSEDGVNWSSAYKVLPTYAQTPITTIGTSGIRAYNINYNVPASAKFVRVDYDLIGNGYIFTNADKTTSEYRYFNDAMYIRKVSIAKANTAAKDFGYVYTTDTEATLGTYGTNVLEVSTRTENGGYTGLNPTWGYLKQNKAAIAGTLPRAYVTYDIMPGTTFESNFSMRYQAIEMSEKTAQKNVDEGLTGAKQELVEYEFFIYGKNKNSDTWEYFGKTNSDDCVLNTTTISYSATFAFGSFSVDFPDYVNQVKIEFPQTGGFYKDTTNWKDIACGNDGAYLYNMKFVAPDSDIVGSHYSKKETANIASTDKKDLSIYHFGGVSIVNGEGIKANANNAFVIYKIKENTMLSLKSDDDLSFEYSVDDISYKPFEAVRVKGYYEIPAISGRNYIKVKLTSGETVNYANAEMAAPTAKFYIPYLNKYELVDYADYGSTANSVSSTLSTLRPGYTFTGWSGYDDEQVYIDTVYEATFVKSGELSYTVDWTVNGVTETKTDVKFDDKITITAPRENGDKVFVKWVDGKKNTVSDNPTFSFLASGSISLTAVYADEKEALDPYIYMTETPVITANDDGTWNLSVVWRSAMPRDVYILETGILLGKDVEKSGLVLWDGKVQSGTAKMKHNNTSANKTAMYTVKNIKTDTVRTALPYARLSTGAVIYADNVIKVKDGVKIDSDFEFYGKISPEVLSRYLDRSLTYTAFDTTGSETRTSAIYGTKDVIRQIGAKYFARALCHWMPSSNDENMFDLYKDAIKQVHDMDPEIIMEACIFETCNEGMNGIAIPEWVFEAFGKTPETRNFDYNLMRHEDHAATDGFLGIGGTDFLAGYGWNQWGENKHIPSISTDEFQMFVYYRACRYIDMGIESIHFGQMNLVGAITEYERDSITSKTGHWKITGYDTASWTKVIDMINAYAKDHARRGYLIVNGHYPNQNLTRSDDSSKMLVDFNMFPLRLTAKTGSTSHTPSEGFQEVMLQTSGDAPYLSSRQENAANKTSPSGYTYTNYPYLLEFDNWGVSNVDNLDTPTGAWGYDEISWYANQNAADRHQYLIDISLEVKNLTTAPNGHVALPGRRTAYISAFGCSEYLEQEWTQNYINDDTNKYKGIGVQHPLWDIRIAGDVDALKAAWTAIGSYGNHYDYTAEYGDDQVDITNANKTQYGISEFGGIALLNNEKSGTTTFRGIHPGWGSLNTDWSDSTTAPYVIYKVKPGTVMSIDLHLYQTGKTVFEDAGHDFDFKIECAASTSGSWKNAVTTDSYTTNDINILYTVPTDCNYVKITFPQKGKTGSTNGNDYARIMGVRFISQ